MFGLCVSGVVCLVCVFVRSLERSVRSFGCERVCVKRVCEMCGWVFYGAAVAKSQSDRAPCSCRQLWYDMMIWYGVMKSEDV